MIASTFTTCKFDIRFASHISNSYLPVLDDWYNNLAPRRAIAGYVPWKFLDVRHKLCLRGLCRCSADSAAECNRLARDLPVERSKDELIRGAGV